MILHIHAIVTISFSEAAIQLVSTKCRDILVKVDQGTIIVTGPETITEPMSIRTTELVPGFSFSGFVQSGFCWVTADLKRADSGVEITIINAVFHSVFICRHTRSYLMLGNQMLKNVKSSWIFMSELKIS